MSKCLFISIKRTEINTLHTGKSQWDFRWTLRAPSSSWSQAVQSHSLGISPVRFPTVYPYLLHLSHVSALTEDGNPWISNWRGGSLRLKGGSGIPALSCENDASGHLKLTYGTRIVPWLTVWEVWPHFLHCDQCTSRIMAFLGAS